MFGFRTQFLYSSTPLLRARLRPRRGENCPADGDRADDHRPTAAHCAPAQRRQRAPLRVAIGEGATFVNFAGKRQK
jgi:hypothetical protein